MSRYLLPKRNGRLRQSKAVLVLEEVTSTLLRLLTNVGVYTRPHTSQHTCIQPSYGDDTHSSW